MRLLSHISHLLPIVQKDDFESGRFSWMTHFGGITSIRTLFSPASLRRAGSATSPPQSLHSTRQSKTHLAVIEQLEAVILLFFDLPSNGRRQPERFFPHLYSSFIR